MRFGAPLLAPSWRERMEASPLPMVGLLVNGLLAGLQVLMVHAALQPSPRLGAGLWWVLGAFFVLLGLLMPRVRRNPWIGVRTPWTMASDENWARTHRFAGYTMTGGGLCAVVAALAGAPAVGLAFILVGSFAPAVYSWRIARRAG